MTEGERMMRKLAANPPKWTDEGWWTWRLTLVQLICLAYAVKTVFRPMYLLWGDNQMTYALHVNGQQA